MNDKWDVPTIQRAHFESWVGRKVLAIIEMPSGEFEVYNQTADGVAPPSDYPSMRKAVARLLQLAGTGAVAPQTWPESVCIGHVALRDDSTEPR